MKKVIVPFVIIASAITAYSQQAESNDILGRPYEDFSTTAFCSYSSYHPSTYITDNNWDILCAFRTPGDVSKLDSLNIPYNQSQLRLLLVGDMMSFSNGIYKTKMPIFDQMQTAEIRTESRAFADSILPTIEPKIRELISAFNAQGYHAQIYSLVFSYLLDGYIWADGKLPTQNQMESHGTWAGAYWAMYNKRLEAKSGTNGYGPLLVCWTEDLTYWPSDEVLINFAHLIMEGKLPVVDVKLKNDLLKWNLVDSEGKPTIPMIKNGKRDAIDVLCDEIASTISSVIKSHSSMFASKYNIASRQEAQVIFYHEVMWDLLALLESNGLIEKPAILKGEEVGTEHFSDISFIVLSD
jgi:hypothetical protein